MAQKGGLVKLIQAGGNAGFCLGWLKEMALSTEKYRRSHLLNLMRILHCIAVTYAIDRDTSDAQKEVKLRLSKKRPEWQGKSRFYMDNVELKCLFLKLERYIGFYGFRLRSVSGRPTVLGHGTWILLRKSGVAIPICE